MLISIHVVIVSGYSTTLALTAASILEDRHDFTKAKRIYEKYLPHVRHDNLLAALYHRQGVLQVLHQDHEKALAIFKRILANYSEYYAVYERAKKYVESYEKKDPSSKNSSKILSVKHQTYEQAASCFPNSLSVILNFYEEASVSTRELSYSIKEDFSSGTFIWKAESFLAENGYILHTTFWQDKEMLISLLNAGFPVLLYVQGHVYTLYGFDSSMEMFFTYDTAESNRWSDKPFWELQEKWMQSSFLMSVVIPEKTQSDFKQRFPKLFNNQDTYKLWQKILISRYYEQKGNYWADFDPFDLSQKIGLDRLKISDASFIDRHRFPFPWSEQEWSRTIEPVLEQPWAKDWSRMETYIVYLIHNGQSERALKLIESYETRISKDRSYFYPWLFELKLAAVKDIGKTSEILSTSNKLIGISNSENTHSSSYWGYYYKAKNHLGSEDTKGALNTVLPVLDNVFLYKSKPSPSIKLIINMIHKIDVEYPNLIDPEKKALLNVCRTYLGISS